MLSFDFSTLPQRRAYAQMGKLGKLGACTWYTPWDCYTSPDVQNAKNELEQAHTTLINLVNATTQFYQDAQANGAPGDLISALGSDAQIGRALVQEHSNLMSKFYAETGTGVAGLKGLHGRNGLGFAVLGLAIPELITLLAGAAQSIAAWYLMNKVGDVVGEAARAFQENAKIGQEKFKRDGQYYIAWKDAREKGIEPPPPPDNSDAGFSGDLTTIALIAGSIFLVFMLTKK